MRVNVDSHALTDPRIKKLGLRLGCDWREALGRILSVWMLTYDRKNTKLDREDIDIAAEKVGFADAMVAVDLAIEVGGKLHIRGAKERIEFLKKQQYNAVKGGRPKNPTVFEKKPNGLPEPNPTVSQTKTLLSTLSLPLSQSLSLSQDQALGLVPREARQKPKPKPRAKLSVRSESWAPGDRHREKAKRLGLDCEHETERFKNFHDSKANLFADWDKAFHTWLDGALNFSRPAKNGRDVRVGRAEPLPPEAYLADEGVPF